MLQLRGHGPWEKTYWVLGDEDICRINERAWSEEEKAVQQRLRDLGQIVEGGMAVAGMVAAGEGCHTMSWIWYDLKLSNGSKKADLQDGMWSF
jgi:hypothetical protein